MRRCDDDTFRFFSLFVLHTLRALQYTSHATHARHRSHQKRPVDRWPKLRQGVCPKRERGGLPLTPAC